MERVEKKKTAVHMDCGFMVMDLCDYDGKVVRVRWCHVYWFSQLGRRCANPRRQICTIMHRVQKKMVHFLIDICFLYFR